MNYCRTCKYKGDILEFEGKKTSYFLCEKIEHGNGDKYWHDGFPAGKKAHVEDGSGYHAALCVEDDFGCVLWEAA